MLAADAGRWFRDWGTLIAAGVAAAVSIWNAMTSYKARRQDWLRAIRVPRYAEFVRAAHEVKLTKLTIPDDAKMEHVKALKTAIQTFNGAFAEVRIVGPTTVSIAAWITSESLLRVPNGTAANAEGPVFHRALDDFIQVASKAIGTDDEQRVIDYDKWLATPLPERKSWP